MVRGGPTALVSEHTPSASEHAERSIARLFLATRAAQLSLSALMVIGDRRRFSRPKLQLAVLGLVAAESAWLARRLLRAGRFQDRSGMWVDTVSSAAGLVTSSIGLGAGDAAPWMKNVAIGSALGASSSEVPAERAAAVGLLALAALGTSVRARGRDRHVAGLGLALNDVISWTGMHVACSLYVAAHRRYARLEDEAAAVALEQAQEAAAEAERSHQHRLVHQATIETLEAIANSDDPKVAGALARQEAGRLRHILRTNGQIPTGLDSALYEVSEAVRERGLQVELVTADLAADVPPQAIAPLREAVHVALLAGHEFAAAERVVVRAASDSEVVSVTVRHHAGGFAPGGGSLYERRLEALGPLLAPIAGHVETWSEHDAGVRVTITVEAGDPTFEPGNGRPASDGGRPFPRPPHAPAGTAREVPAERRSPEAGVGAPGWFAPGVSLNGDDSEHRRLEAERTIVTPLMAWRWSGLATGAAALVAGRRRYRSSAAAAAQLAVAVVESTWLTRSLRRSGYRLGRREHLLDATTAIGLLMAGRANLVDEDLWTWINWAPWSFAANAVAGQAIAEGGSGTGEAAAAAISLAGAAVAVRRSDRIANGAGMALFFAGSQVLVRQIRNGASRLEAVRAAAVEKSRLVAAERERSRQLRLLHDGALQTLETVGSGRYGDLAAVQVLAREEARRLADELAGTMDGEATLVDSLRSLVRGHARLGLDIELTTDDGTSPPVPAVELVEPAPRVRRALQDAASEALTNVRKHAGVSRAELGIVPGPHGVEVTIRDEGSGFDPTRRGPGFGTVESIVRRMSDVGGSAVIESAPGKGTKVTLWGPT